MLIKIYFSKVLLFLICTLVIIKSNAQLSEDTLQIAQSLVEKKEWVEAERLLATYHQSSQTPYSYQLHAQLLYWLKQPDKAVLLYEKGINLFPDAPFLKLDYGRMLITIGQLKNAHSQLTQFISTDSLHTEGNILLSYLLLWKGQVAKARDKIELLQKVYPANEDVKSLTNYANTAYSDRLHMGFQYLSDDQPLQSNQFEAGYTAYRSPLLSPTLLVRSNQFSQPNTKSIWLRAANTFQLNFSKTKLTTEVGWFTFHQNSSKLTSRIDLLQKLSPVVSIQLNTARLPYQFTSISNESPLIYKLHNGSLLLDHKNIMASAGLAAQQFSDNNTILTSFAWGLVPLIKKGGFKLMIGYSYSYSNARRSSFQSIRPIEDVIQNQFLYTNVDGIYAPYFTPLDQSVHSLLTNVLLNFSNNWSIKANLSYGVKATSDNPFLLLEKENSVGYFIHPYQYKQAYTPIEADIYLQLSPKGRIHSQVFYKYDKLFFYTRNEAGIQLSYRLTN